MSGLKAQAQNMGIIADNISNANTVGYKASVNKFETLVTTPATPTTYTPGGVLSRPFANVDAQGLLAASASRTDVGITGRGFLPVTNSVGTSGTLNTTVNNTFTRAGSFTVDKNGNLVNSAGFFLLGVPINQTTGKPTISNPAVQSLSLVNVGTLTGIAKGTTSLSIGANLPAVPTASTPLGLAGIIKGAAVTTTTDTLNTYTVYSSTGNAYTLSNVKYAAAVLAAGTRSVTVTANIAPVGASPALSGANPITLGTISVSASGGTATTGAGATFTDGSTWAPTIDASALRIASTAAAASYAASTVSVDPQDVTAVVYDSLGVANNLTLEFTRTAALNVWALKLKSMTVVGTSGSSTTTTLPAWINGTADTSTVTLAVQQANAKVTFNTNGTVAAGYPATIFGSVAAGLTLSDGANGFGGTTNPVNLSLGTAGTPSGLTQYSNKFAVSFINQNGLAFSFRTGVAFDVTGQVNAVFDNGTVIPLYKIPLVNFSNVDALQAETGNVYTETVESGSAVSNFAGLGGTGTITPASLEQSTVDLSNEFTNMIITQRSFSANARTITTADNELQEVVNLVR
ncbi:MAG: flagellar hook-basal body complex protein [Proteobacteria bacterium]|nr:flagellar hook-basal body complex protein [Pseudomonadota bacterium]